MKSYSRRKLSCSKRMRGPTDDMLPMPNIWVQATPGYACVSFLGHGPGAPDPGRRESWWTNITDIPDA
jgi:hypothetical protein